ncbi:hypothetical protein PMX38_07475, partial [Collinsella aerofaciens]
MADRIKFGRFVHSDAGVIAVTKGAGVRAWVATETARLAARANAEAASHHVPSGYRRSLEKKYQGTFDSAPYVGVVKLDWQHLFGRFREGQPRLP